MTTSKKLRDMKLPPGYNACLLLDAADEIDRLTRERDEHARWRAELADKLHATESLVRELRAELERERMRLVACGVVAMSNTSESAERNREMHTDYRSASCDEVARAVDREMALRAERDALAKGISAVAALIAESRGVAGLHLNGDEAPWDDLRTGGQYDGWLRDFDVANAQIEKERSEQAEEQ